MMTYRIAKRMARNLVKATVSIAKFTYHTIKDAVNRGNIRQELLVERGPFSIGNWTEEDEEAWSGDEDPP